MFAKHSLRLSCVLCVFCSCLIAAAQSRPVSAARPANPGKLELSFAPNEGQFDAGVQFAARGAGYSIALRDGEATIALGASNPSGDFGTKGPQLIRLHLVGRSANLQATPEDKQRSESNYLVGSDASHWRTGVANYGRVRYRSVYPGIDLVYYGNQGELEHDFVVAPGADPNTIRLRLETEGRLLLIHDAIEIRSMRGTIRLPRPVIYQQVDGKRTKVGGGYRMIAANEIGFEVAAYDRARPLVIDPTVTLATRFGGSNYTVVNAAAYDASGNFLITGSTEATDLPLVQPFQSTCGGGSCAGAAFVSKISADGSTLLYSTYLGGISGATANAVAVDASGNILVAGSTSSSDFPIANAFQASCANSCNGGSGFVTKLDPTGSKLVFSTFLGGSSFESGVKAMGVDPSGNVYVTGQTNSKDFPLKNAFQPALSGFSDAFVTKFGPTGALLYSTFLGGSSTETATAIKPDSAGDAFVAGSTSSANFPTTTGAFQTACGGGCVSGKTDAFMTVLDPSGSKLLYSTFIGGSGNDAATGLAFSPNGVVVVGTTQSTNFPTTTGALQTSCGGCADGVNSAFVLELKPSGSAAVYSTYLGGSGDTQARAVAVDTLGDVLVGGNTAAPDFPTTAGLQAVGGGGVFKSTDNAKTWKAANAGLKSAVVRGIAVDNTGRIVYAGTSAGVYKSSDSGNSWSAATSGIPSGSQVGAIAVDPAHSSTLYAAIDTSGVYKSTDGGATWTSSSSGLNGGTFASLAVDPTNSANVYVGGSAGLYKSTNSGGTWAASGTGLPTGAAVNAIVIDPTQGSTIFAGVKTPSSTGGVFRSTNGGAAWTAVSTGLTNVNVNALAIDPTNHLTLICGTDGDTPQFGQPSTHPGGVFKSVDGGNSWTIMLTIPNFNFITAVAIDPAGSSNLYADLGQSELARSSDGGATWFGHHLNEAKISALAFQTGATPVLYAGTDGRSSFSGSNDGFVSILNPTGSALNLSTYIGGTGGDQIQALKLTPGGQLFAAGYSNSLDFAGVGSGPGGGSSSPPASISRLSPSSSPVGSGSFTLTVYATQSSSASIGLPDTVNIAISDPEVAARLDRSVHSHDNFFDDGGPSDASLMLFFMLVTDGLRDYVAPEGPCCTTNAPRVNPVTAVEPESSNVVNTGTTTASVRSSTVFASGATVLWNGTPLATTYVDANTLTAQVPASNLATTGTAQVSVQNPGAAASNSVPFYVTNAVVPQPGWWWDPNLNGTGFFVEFGGKSNNGMFLAGFLYDAAGNATWLVSTGQMSGSTYNSNWLKVTGGQTLLGPYSAPTAQTPVGNIAITFTDSTHGVMTRPDGTKINIQRFSFSAGSTISSPAAGAAQSGWWWAGSAFSGTGIGVEVQGSAIFAVAYYYDASGNPVWYLATGGMTSPTGYTGTWDVYAGGPQLTSPEGSYSAHKVSTATPMTLTFTSATTGTLTMGNVTVPIVRFQEF